jgi:hypothetical protein
MRLPGIHAINLNLADQAKQTRAISEELNQLKDTVLGLRHEVRSAAAANDASRKATVSLEATVEQAVQATWRRLRKEVIDEALYKTRETWGKQQAALEDLREQHQTTQKHLRTLLEPRTRQRRSADDGPSPLWDKVLDKASNLLEERHQRQEDTPKNHFDMGHSRGSLNWDAAPSEVSAQRGCISEASPAWERSVEGKSYGGEFTLGCDQMLEAFPDSHVSGVGSGMPDLSLHSVNEDSRGYGMVLSRLHEAPSEIIGSLQNSFGTEEPEMHAKASPADAGHSSKRNPHRMRQTSRWQLGQVFSSESESDLDGALRNAVARTSGLRALHSRDVNGLDSAKRHGLSVKAARSQLQQQPRRAGNRSIFSSDSEAGGEV